MPLWPGYLGVLESPGHSLSRPFHINMRDLAKEISYPNFKSSVEGKVNGQMLDHISALLCGFQLRSVKLVDRLREANVSCRPLMDTYRVENPG